MTRSRKPCEDLGAEPSMKNKCLEAVTGLMSSKEEEKGRMTGTK